MATYWTRKGDKEDLDEKTVSPWAMQMVNAGGELPHPHHHVVCAVVQCPSEMGTHRYLCVQKGETRFPYTSHHWEFPGGKLEEGETPQQALRRELLEEMGYEVEVGLFLCQVEHTYPHFTITMQAYLCRAAHTRFTLTEHTLARWCTVEEMQALPWCDADRPVVEQLLR